MNESLIALLRRARFALHLAVEPWDLIARLLNNKHSYPPIWARQLVGGLSDFEGSGGEYTAYLKLLCGLQPEDELLDLGCGYGLMTYDTTGAGSLLDYVGHYTGVDTDKWAMRWCKRNIEHPNATFLHLPEGTLYLPFEPDKCFDVILAKSLFTHLFQRETLAYLTEIQRLLAPGGYCLATFFLLNNQELRGEFTFQYPALSTPNVAYQRETKPRLAVAYQEKWLLDRVEALGLSVEVYHGTWRGNYEGLSFQDIVILGRP